MCHAFMFCQRTRKRLTTRDRTRKISERKGSSRGSTTRYRTAIPVVTANKRKGTKPEGVHACHTPRIRRTIDFRCYSANMNRSLADTPKWFSLHWMICCRRIEEAQWLHSWEDSISR